MLKKIIFMNHAFVMLISVVAPACGRSHTSSEGDSTQLFLNHEGTETRRSTCNSVSLCLCGLTPSSDCVPVLHVGLYCITLFTRKKRKKYFLNICGICNKKLKRLMIIADQIKTAAAKQYTYFQSNILIRISA